MTTPSTARINGVANQRRTTHAIVGDEIHRRILDGILRPGDRLVLDELARALGVSPTPVREALHQLTAEGTITLDPYRGFSVSELTAEEAEDLYETRGVIEGLAARIAVPRLSVDDLAQLHAAIKAMERAAETDDPVAYLHSDRVFHTILYTASGRHVLNRQVFALLSSSVRYQRYQLARLREPKAVDTSLKAHRLILAACERGDAKLVEQLIQEHLRTAGSRVIRALATEVPPGAVESATDGVAKSS